MSIKAVKPRYGQTFTQTAWCVNQLLDSTTKGKYPLTSSEINLLVALRIQKKMTLSQVCATIGISPQERTALVLSLYRQEMITPHPVNNEQGIILTPKGEQALLEAQNYIEESEEKALTGFSEEEKAVLFKLMGKIQKNCQLVS